MSKKVLYIGVITGVVILVLVAGYFVVNSEQRSFIACTQEAKQCPDGSYVGRTGQYCEFAECPQVNPSPSPTPIPTPTPTSPPSRGEESVYLRSGQQAGSLLVEKVYSDYVTGLNFWEYPVGGGPGHLVTLHIGESVSNGCTVTMTLMKIKGSSALFTKKTEVREQCPICLAANTLIDTPSGFVPVKNLEMGMSIWTANKDGQRVSGVVTKIARVPVPPTHQMVHVVFDDGRELFVSPGHPTTDGRIASDLVMHDLYDSARVVASELVAYDDVATYDILPSGETGFYFAGGILLDSTLH